MRDWREIYANIHTDDFAGFLKPSEESWNGVTVFRWEGRAYVRGELRWFSAESNPRPRSGGGAYWDGVIFDITARKRAEAEAQAARDEERAMTLEKVADLERAMKTSLMAAAVAHDVKQPLGMALFHAQQLVERIAGQPLEADVRAIIGNLAAESRQVAESIDRMRGLLQSVETTTEPFDLGHIARSAARVTERRAAQAGVSVEVNLPPDPVAVVGDASQMQVAITNLVVNAIEAIDRHAEAGGRIRIEVIPGEHAAECVVGDSGPGYEPARARVGEAEGRAGGTGMGLHIVRSVLENHRAILDIGRSPLGGAEFRIRLPRAPVP
jgi:signal transduction histidine kinase